jgi:hypothetical protein
LGPGSDEREELSDVKPAVVPVPEGGEGASAAGWGGGHAAFILPGGCARVVRYWGAGVG